MRHHEILGGVKEIEGHGGDLCGVFLACSGEVLGENKVEFLLSLDGDAPAPLWLLPSE